MTGSKVGMRPPGQYNIKSIRGRAGGALGKTFLISTKETQEQFIFSLPLDIVRAKAH